MPRKCIGVIISRPEADYQRNLLKGIFAEAFAANYNVAVFSTSNTDSFAENVVYPMRIFDLPNADNISGLIYVHETIYGVDTEALTERMRALAEKRRVVVVDSKPEGLDYIISSDRKAVKRVTAHLIEEHGCKTIAYMTGPEGHEHSERRLAAFRDEMSEHGLSVDDELIFYGDFWYEAGESVAEKLIKRGKLPDAVICASDRMAYSVYKAFNERGYSVPEDILIAAYAEENAMYDFFTSCGKNTELLGKLAVKKLIGNDESAAEIDESLELHSSFTCGCVQKNVVRNIYSEGAISEYNGFFSINNDMKDRLVRTADFEDFFWVMSWFTHYLGDITHFSISLSKGGDVLDIAHKVKYDRSQPMNLVYQRNNFHGEDERTVDFTRLFDISVIHPILQKETEEPQAYFFYPFVSDDTTFGYAAVSYRDKTRSVDEIYPFWLKDVLFCLESQKRLFTANQLFDKMERFAITDNMTGLINRNGFEERSGELFNYARRTGKKLAVVMADLNCLKYINDTFGHEQGDKAIKTAAQALSGFEIRGTEKEENFRLGGDEYLKVSVGNFTDEDAQDMLDRIRSYLDKVNSNMKNEYPVILSIGFCVDTTDGKENIDDLVTQADINMYADKVREKKRTGFDVSRHK